jgi:hypothetical protein
VEITAGKGSLSHEGAPKRRALRLHTQVLPCCLTNVKGPCDIAAGQGRYTQ